MTSSTTGPVPPDNGDLPDGRPYRRRWTVAAVVLAANVVDLLDATIVNVAGPSVRRDLGGGASTIQWLGAGYTLAFAVVLLAGARLGDIVGRRRLFLIGSVSFTLFSAACAAAPTPELLITFRVLQGAGGALMIPQGFGLLKQVFDDETELGKALGLFGPASGVSMLAAPVIAGALVSADLWGTGWRSVFLINIPIGLITVPLAVRSLPRGASRPGLRLDVSGIGLVALAMVAIIYPLIQAQSAGWPAWCFGLMAIGVGLLAAFLLQQRRRGGDALIEPTLLTNRAYLSGVAVRLAVFGAFSGLLLCISLYGQLGRQWSAIHAGLTLTPMVAGIILGMTGSGRLVNRLGRRLLHVGVLLIAAGATGLALTAAATGTASSYDLAPSLLLIGAGVGATIGQLFRFILASVSMNEIGSASGVMEAAQQLATALGIAVLGTVFISAFQQHPATYALQVTAWACLAPLALAFLLVYRLPAPDPAGTAD